MCRCQRAQSGAKAPAKREDSEALDALTEAVEAGAGLPAVARAAAKVLDASVALIDRSSAVLAVAGASPDQEQKLLSGGEGVVEVELRVADTAVGELRYRARPRSPTRRSRAWSRPCWPWSWSGPARRSGRARRRRRASSAPCSRAR